MQHWSLFNALNMTKVFEWWISLSFIFSDLWINYYAIEQINSTSFFNFTCKIWSFGEFEFSISKRSYHQIVGSRSTLFSRVAFLHEQQFLHTWTRHHNGHHHLHNWIILYEWSICYSHDIFLPYGSTKAISA